MPREYQVSYKGWIIIVSALDRKKANYEAYKIFCSHIPTEFKTFASGISSTTLYHGTEKAGTIFYGEDF